MEEIEEVLKKAPAVVIIEDPTLTRLYEVVQLYSSAGEYFPTKSIRERVQKACELTPSRYYKFVNVLIDRGYLSKIGKNHYKLN